MSMSDRHENIESLSTKSEGRSRGQESRSGCESSPYKQTIGDLLASLD
jgi:hypothetical protein